MTGPVSMDGWPEGSSALVARVTGSTTIVARTGDTSAVRPWASVSKFAVATAMALEFDRGRVDLDAPAGPPGATVRHLLSHASGLGLEAADPVRPVGTRRVYSNVGVDLAVETVHPGDPVRWLHQAVMAPLGLNATLDGRPSSGVTGSLDDMVTLGAAWLNGTITVRTVETFTTPFLAGLDGVVPGFGGFRPNPWGLGPEVHGQKHHWMGTVLSDASFGHFGQSGTLCVCDPERALIVAAAASAPFGPWAVRSWPTWIDQVVSDCGSL